MKPVHFIFVCLVVVAAFTDSQPPRHRLRYALFTSGSGSAFDSSGAIPAIELAEEEITKDPSILSGYSFQHTAVQDTFCSRTRSLNLFFATVAEANPPVLGLLGCGCSVATEPVAEIVHHWNITQVAYSSSAVVLSDKERFVNFFRTAPSDASFVPAIVSLLQTYGWTRMVVITQDQNLFTDTYENLRPLLMMNNITVRNRVVPNSISELQTYIRDEPNFFFPDEDTRIIFINSYSNAARITVCEAMRSHDLTGYPRYVWITYAWYQDKWWTSAVNGDPVMCSENEFVELLRQSLAIGNFPFSSNPDAQTDVGMTTNQFFNQYMERLSNYTFSHVAPVAYDALWSLAFALNKTEEMLLSWEKDKIINETSCEDDGIELDNFDLGNFTYDHFFVGCVIRWNLQQTNFTGVSGHVSFDDGGTRAQDDVIITQYQSVGKSGEIASELIARINKLENYTFQYVDSQNNNTVFPGGVPLDGTPIRVPVSYHLALVVIYDVLAGLGLVFTTVCFVFNFTFRNRKIIRLTSPNLNYFIIAGCFIMYASIFIRLMPSTDKIVNYVRCNLQAVLNTLAYCLAYSTVLVKMGRVYHIFHNPTHRKKKPLKDWQMALTILGVSSVGVIIPVLGWAIPTLQAVPSLQPDDERAPQKDEQGITIEYVVWTCGVGNNAGSVYIVIYVYIILIQIIGIILAVQTRNVKVKALNDSKYIAALIYISTIVWLFTGIVIFILPWNIINISEMIYSGGLLLAVTVFLCLTFIPKMVNLYQDPEGENIFSDTMDISKSRSQALSCSGNPAKESELMARIKELEMQLREAKKNIPIDAHQSSVEGNNSEIRDTL